MNLITGRIHLHKPLLLKLPSGRRTKLATDDRIFPTTTRAYPPTLQGRRGQGSNAIVVVT